MYTRNAKIVGGENAKFGQNPWQVAIVKHQFLNQKITLIDPITHYNQMNNNSKNLNVHRTFAAVDRRHFYGTNANIDKIISIAAGRKNSHSFPLKYEIRLLEYIGMCFLLFVFSIVLVS